MCQQNKDPTHICNDYGGCCTQQHFNLKTLMILNIGIKYIKYRHQLRISMGNVLCIYAAYMRLTCHSTDRACPIDSCPPSTGDRT